MYSGPIGHSRNEWQKVVNEWQKNNTVYGVYSASNMVSNAVNLTKLNLTNIWTMAYIFVIILRLRMSYMRVKEMSDKTLEMSHEKINAICVYYSYCGLS